MTTRTTPRGRRTIVVGLASAGTGIAGLIIGSVLGATAGADSEPAAATETITVTETPEPITETVEVETVPQECLDALTDSETVNGYSSDALGLAGDAIVAASEFDTVTLESITEEITGMKDDMDPHVSSYVANAETCRNTAEEGQ